MTFNETKVINDTAIINNNGIVRTTKTSLIILVKNQLLDILSSNRYISAFIKLLTVFLVLFMALNYYQGHKSEQQTSDKLILDPKIDDIYFLDFRLLSKKLRPKEKYRVAKIYDITGNIVTLRYGDLLFPSQQKAKDSIRYGQLRYEEYFQPERFDFTFDEIKKMRESGAIYLAKRPERNKLYGNFVSPAQPYYHSSILVQGRKEFYSGLAHFNNRVDELRLAKAFSYFEQSATLGYPEGQIRLAEMYLNGFEVEKNLKQTLYWLNQAALQSNKRAILKYGIVCKQVIDCNIVDFYQTLIDSGVNLKVRNVDVKLTPTIN